MTKTSTKKRSGALRALADRLGIIPEYVDQTGKEVRATTDRTRVALLRVLGIDASSERAAARALKELDERERGRVLAPVRVIRRDELTRDAMSRNSALRNVARSTRAELRVPDGWSGLVYWTLEVREEGGQTHQMEGRAPPRQGVLRIALPQELEVGYHSLDVSLQLGGEERRAEQTLIVVPSSCPRPIELLRGHRVFGIVANLYTVRSDRNWGAGDFGDLRELVAWADDVGAGFVGLNPLHALRNRGSGISPYSPVSRLFRNVLYLDVESVPEMSDSSEARQVMESGAFRRALERVRQSTHVDYEAVMSLKRPVLEALHRTFVERHRGRDTPRGHAYACYRAEQGEALDDFATFSALEESVGGGRREKNGAPWQSWPPELHDPRSEAVRRFREEHAELVDLHRWLQFELDAQLATAAKRAREGGLPIGLYQDLAIGTSPASSDTWMFPGLFLRGVSIGAPPDPLASSGQNWGLPPIDPRRLVEDRYRYWITLVRSALRHSGALRIDHVMGLFRQFWIPEGKTGKDGAYVRFPAEDLLGILALESTRASALVVGEDLGTVPEDVPPALERWQILSSKVLYFERGQRGFRPAASYKPLALATANTHDLPTLAGFWKGRDIELREKVGQLGTRKAVKEALAVREEERSDLVKLLTREGILPQGLDDVSTVRLRSAVHTFLRRTPSWLVGLSLDDLVGEEEPVNLPGVGPEQFGSWTRRLATNLGELRTDPDVERALGAEREWVG